MVELFASDSIIRFLAILMFVIAIVCLFFICRKLRYKELSELLEITGVDNKKYAIKKRNGYIKYYEIRGIDIINMSKNDKNMYMNNLRRFIKSNIYCSFIYINVPCNFNEHLYDDIEIINNDNLELARQYKLNKIIEMNNNKLDEKVYLILDVKDKKELKQSISNVERLLSTTCPLVELDIEETIKVMKLSTNQYKLIKTKKEGNYE